MDIRIMLFILLLGTSWCCNARVVTTSFSPAQDGITSALQQIDYPHQESEIDVVKESEANEQICTLCKNIASPVLTFLKDTSNQKKITSTLSTICSYTLGLKDKCSTAVDYYLPILYLQVATMTPKTFCITIGLCDLIVSTSQHHSKNSCETCHDLVAEVLLKLKDPEAQLEATEVLLKACDALEDFEDFAKKCKTAVSSFAPLILANIEQLLESYDVCSTVHGCSSASNATAYVEYAF